MKAGSSSDFLIPIIPIPNVVFFPHTVLPILIEEPVYIRMVKKRAEEGQWIGIALADPVGEVGGVTRYGPRKIFGAGKPIILDEEENGLRILVKGIVRMERVEIHQNLPYLVYKSKILPDFDSHQTLVSDSAVSRLTELLDKWINQHITDSLERDYFNQNLLSLHHIVDYICTFVIQDPLTKQLLLENCNLHERIQILNSLFKEERPFEENPFVLEGLKSFEELPNFSEVAH